MNEVVMTLFDERAPFFYFLAFFTGSIFGSFSNVVIARLPKGESVVHPRSHCPNCGEMIPSWLNIPILSWILLLGKCRFCKIPISIRYPIVELTCALLWLGSAYKFGFSFTFLAAIILSTCLLIITFIDLDHWIIPEEIILFGVAGAALHPVAFGGPWWGGLLGAAVGAGFLAIIRWGFMKLRGIEGMGLGDVELMGMIGAFFGALPLLPVLLVASLSGSVVGIALLIVGKMSENKENEGQEEERPAIIGDLDLQELEAVPEVPLVLERIYDGLFFWRRHKTPKTGPLLVDLVAIPDMLPRNGGEAKILWRAERATHVDIDNDIGTGLPTSGSATTSVKETTYFTVTAHDEEGRKNEDVLEVFVPHRRAIPFGPFLAIGGIAQLLLGDVIDVLFHRFSLFLHQLLV